MTEGPPLPAISFEDVRLVRGGRPLLDGITVSVPAGRITVLSGGSGAGKTTPLRLCNRLEVPDAGRVLLDGKDVAGLDPLRLRRRVGMVFQHPTMLAGTVGDNLHVADPRADDAHCFAALERAALDRGFLGRAALSGGRPSGWRWPARSSPSPRCCCSTSPLRHWMPHPAIISGAAPDDRPRRASPSSGSPTIPPSRQGWPIRVLVLEQGRIRSTGAIAERNEEPAPSTAWASYTGTGSGRAPR